MWIRIAIAIFLVAALASPARADDALPFQVIVHPSNRAASLDRRFVADAFLKKRTRWSDDSAIRPVDLDSQSGTRRRFSRDMIRRSVEAVRSYWRKIVFSGRGVPPPELDTDDAVVTYVGSHRGAIGYVSINANVAGVKVIQVK